MNSFNKTYTKCYTDTSEQQFPEMYSVLFCELIFLEATHRVSNGNK